MDHLQTRLDALEQQMHTATRRLRWWRGLACGAVVLAVLAWALPAGTGQGPEQGLAQRVAALEDLLKHFSREGNEVFITGANLHLVNGLGSTDCFNEEQDQEIPDCPNGLGNLIVGYNEPRQFGETIHTGSHNVVIGQGNNRVNLDLWYSGPPMKGGHRHGHVTVHRSADPPNRGAGFDQSHRG
jgi:hypothetical protein